MRKSIERVLQDFKKNSGEAFMKMEILFLLCLVLSQASNSNAQNWITNGLVGHYLFSGNLNDRTTNHLDFGGTPAFSNDRFWANQSAIVFTNESPLSTANISLGQQGVSGSFWFKLNKAPSSGGERVLMHGSWNSGDGLFSFAVWQDGRCEIIFKNSGAIDTATGAIGLGNWHHVAFAADGLYQTLWLDGIGIGTTTNSLQLMSAPLVIGGDAGYHFQSGQVDDIRIYNRALSSNEVAILYYWEAPSSINMRTAVYLDSSTLKVGTNYQVQLSPDMLTWTNHDLPFTAISNIWRTTNYWDADKTGQLFFRLQQQ